MNKSYNFAEINLSFSGWPNKFSFSEITLIIIILPKKSPQPKNLRPITKQKEPEILEGNIKTARTSNFRGIL